MRVGIIGAMDIEVAHLRQQLLDPQVDECFGMQFWSGILADVPVVVVMCGDGKVNASICTTTLIIRYNVTHVINTGVAGSLDARLGIGDFAIASDAVQHDMDLTPLGYALGQVPALDTLYFEADRHLIDVAMSAVREAAPNANVLVGRVASGDQFVSSVDQKNRIVDSCDAVCCEMEGASIAHVCYLAQVPYAIVRTISDTADGSANVDYPTFKVEAARECAMLVEHMVQNI